MPNVALKLPEHRQVQVSYATAFECLPSPVLVFNQDQTVIWMNRGFTTHTGVEPPSLVGRNVGAALTTDFPTHLGMVIKTLDNGQVWQGNLIVRTAKDDMRLMSAMLSALGSNEGVSHRLYVLSLADLRDAQVGDRAWMEPVRGEKK